MRSYPSVQAAIDAGFPRVRDALRYTDHKKAYKGVFWTYLDKPQVLVVNGAPCNARPVESYDLQTGLTIKRYPSQTSVFNDQHEPSAVGAVLHGRRKSHKGMGWRYTPHPIPAPAPVPAPIPAPSPVLVEDKDAAVTILTTAHRRSELARLNAAVFCDPGGKGYGVRMNDGRILYRPLRQEVVALWYDDNAQVAPAASAQVETASDAKDRRIRRNRPNYCNGHLEAVCLKTGAVRFTRQSTVAVRTIITWLGGMFPAGTSRRALKPTTRVTTACGSNSARTLRSLQRATWSRM
jgi:hypothetical protein